ncbi:UDP-N-acetylmuramoyl-tripeptide--D-alanyl-D-alanine ligase [Aequorivita sp. H23M31]|uniref:UDP-N-acetylmuramoyl-tripeptide--D-alanyl-D-alanine ligase n=1 Tax=Aequorivita ciconiae TaxID=2494375 RepID=A0A410G3F2_9FLAO|nr:UDP-N-acetylmuramoyl-tripeptide--D-alanyl-D-alanine ligase [Aequorivita sp. H23M31]QAA81745.1 UDP-N-acetylmuramoyl-tripeptide--D-alanyl-D-alanine ligase [Aequorivita sp. H23M31]
MDIETLYRHFLQSSGVCTDTRHIQENCIFFALAGENFNGNLFAQEALDTGARMVVVDQEEFHKNTGETFLVNNTLLALQELAQYHRMQLKTKIIALTGSNGKTTTKELINAVLSQKFQTVATKGNLNNHIGVPLTLLSIPVDTEFGIVEMGANHLGEIEMLSNITQPDFGYITNFGKAHLEGFGSLEGVIKGKSELYVFLQQQNKIAFVNANDPKQLESSKENKRVTFGTPESDFNIDLLDSHSNLLLNYRGLNIQSNLVGAYNFMNLSAAIAIGAYFGVSPEKIKEGIESYIPTNNRSQLIKQDTNTILMDAYNANPSSMMAALKNFRQAEGNNKILFLGDMFELGSDALAEHQNIVDFLSENIFGKVLLVGENFFKTKVEASHIKKFRTFDDLKNEIQTHTPSFSFILIKASRGMALERILEVL